MSIRRTGLLAVVPAMFLLGCAGDPAAPNQPEFVRGKQQSQGPQVAIANFQLESQTLVIGGPGVNYTVDIVNPTEKLSDVTLQGEIITLDGTGVVNARRAAGGTLVQCGQGDGLLPHGTCTMSFTLSALNTTQGFGTLVAGPALYSIVVRDAAGGQLAVIFDQPVTLQ